jgi:hypothetical protein
VASELLLRTLDERKAELEAAIAVLEPLGRFAFPLMVLRNHLRFITGEVERIRRRVRQ